jgi:hypothetical protein
MQGWFALRKLRPINIAAVGDPGDEDEIFGIVHRVDDAVIANADSEVIPTGKLYCQTTEIFTVNGDWDLRWSYECSSSLGIRYPKLDQCDFFLTVKQLSDCQVSPENQGVTHHGGKKQGVVHNHAGGTFYFVVDSYCSWTFRGYWLGAGVGRGSGSVLQRRVRTRAPGDLFSWQT